MHKIKSLSRWLLFAALTAILPLAIFGPALAVSGGGVSVFPAKTKERPDVRSWFVYEAEGGTEIKDKVEVINNENKSVTLRVVVLDGAVTRDGGYTLVGDVGQNKDLGTWATLSKSEVTLPPRSREILDLTIKVPENADVGSHPGGVVIWQAPAASSAAKKGSQLSVITRVAARVYLTVPGDIKRILEVESVRHDIISKVLRFYMKLNNKGNVQLEPVGDITIRGLWGKLGAQTNSYFGLVLRSTSIIGSTPWNGKLPTFGRYVADFRIHYGEKDFKGEYVKDEYIDVRYVFWIIPWLKIIFWLGGLLLLLFLRNLWLWLVIQQRLNIKSKKHIIKKGETLTAIAQRYYVHPKKLAKFNLLKWPYELSPGDVLLIPQGRLTKAERLAMGKEWQAYYRAEQRKVMLTDLRFLGRLFGKIRFRRRGGGSITPPPLPSKKVTPPHLPLYKGRQGGVNVATEVLIAERGDTIHDVAEFAGVSVEEIIRLNDLRPPYRLRAGQELLVPAKRKPMVKTKRRMPKPTRSITGQPPQGKKKRRK